MQSRLQQLFDELVASGRECGLQAAVYHDGKLVANVWAGVANPVTGARVDGATLFPVFSTTKGIAATIVHRLVERGLLDYDTPLATYWPEFAADGKAAITLRHALTHTAGLPNLPGDIEPAKLADWTGMCAWLATQSPTWAPGSRMEYHAITYGWLIGEPACRVTGKTFQELLATEICRPLEITDLYCGIPEKLTASIAVLEEPGLPAQFPASSTPTPVPNTLQPLGAWMNRLAAQRACVPASSGVMTARAAARHYAALLPGGGLLPPARVKLATAPQFLASGERIDRYLGYSPVAGAGTFGHAGYGGSFGFAEPERRLAVGFARNRLTHPAGAETVARMLEIIREACPS